MVCSEQNILDVRQIQPSCLSSCGIITCDKKEVVFIDHQISNRMRIFFISWWQKAIWIQNAAAASLFQMMWMIQLHDPAWRRDQEREQLSDQLSFLQFSDEPPSVTNMVFLVVLVHCQDVFLWRMGRVTTIAVCVEHVTTPQHTPVASCVPAAEDPSCSMLEGRAGGRSRRSLLT